MTKLKRLVTVTLLVCVLAISVFADGQMPSGDYIGQMPSGDRAQANTTSITLTVIATIISLLPV